MNQLLTHPATNPDGTCNNQSCPCQQWSKQAAAITDNDTVSDEPGKINPYEYLKTFKYPPDTEKALRNTRSIVHHAEMVEEQARRERCVKCNHSGFVDSRGVCRQFTRENYQPGGSLTCGCECVFPVTATTPEDQRTQTTFEQHWQEAPKSIKHGCEMSSAEFFYHAGRRDRETEMLREVNTVLSGVAQRIGQERLR